MLNKHQSPDNEYLEVYLQRFSCPTTQARITRDPLDCCPLYLTIAGGVYVDLDNQKGSGQLNMSLSAQHDICDMTLHTMRDML